MKTKILALTLMIGLPAVALAQTASPAGSAPVHGQEPAIPSPNDDRVNQMTPELTNNGNSNRIRSQTNGMNSYGSSNSWPSSENNGWTNRNGVGGMNGSMATNKYNPYANYINPNSVSINPNSTNVNPYANYTNPYVSGGGTDSPTNRSGGNYGNDRLTNISSMNGMTNESNTNTNRPH
jgi:hypothetical protein